MGRLSTVLVKQGVTANAVSVAGLVGGLLAGVALGSWGCWAEAPMWARVVMPLVAAGLIQFRLLCNLIDGMVAIEGGGGGAGGVRSPVGPLYNEIPDRIADSAILIGAGLVAGSSLRLGLLAGLIAVLTAYIRESGRASGAGSDYGGPMAKPQRMALMTGTCVLLAIAPMLQTWRFEGPVARTLTLGEGVNAGVMAIALGVVVVGGALTCVLRLRRIADKLRAASGATGGEASR